MSGSGLVQVHQLVLGSPPGVSLSEVQNSVTMSDTKRLAFSIIQFLHDQLQSGSLTPDAQESLEGESAVLSTNRSQS